MQYSTYHIHVCQLFCHNVVLKRGEFFWIADLQVLSINQVTGGSATEPIWPGWKTPLSEFIQQTMNQSRCLFCNTTVLQQNGPRALPDVMAPLCHWSEKNDQKIKLAKKRWSKKK